MPSLTKPRASAPRRPGGPPGARLSVLVACPDARPPAYEAVVGLAGTGDLGRFVTGFYYRGHGVLSEVARKYAPCQFRRIRRQLLRRHERRIPEPRRGLRPVLRPRPRRRESARRQSAGATTRRTLADAPFRSGRLPRDRDREARSGPPLQRCRFRVRPSRVSKTWRAVDPEHGPWGCRRGVGNPGVGAGRVPRLLPALSRRRPARPQCLGVASQPAEARRRPGGSDPRAVGTHRRSPDQTGHVPPSDRRGAVRR